MSRIDEMPEYRARLNRQTHDLSHKFGFTCTVAHLLPVFHDFLNPGETVELAFNYNLRTQPLQSAAMVDIKTHVEYFFVPIQLLYEPFGSMFFNLNDNYSSLYPLSSFNPNVQNQFPVLDFADVIGDMQTYKSNIIGFEPWFNHVVRLFDHLGYNSKDIANSSATDNWNPNVFPYPILAYNCIYEYYYRLDTRERFAQQYFNWDKYYNTATVNSGFVEYYNLIRLHYRPKDNDYFTDAKVSPIVDVLNLNVKNSLAVTNDWLSRSQLKGYQDVVSNVISSGGVGSPSDSYGNVPPNGNPANNPSSNIQTNFGMQALGTDAIVDQDGKTILFPNGLDLNTANIRAIFANEKLWSITGRARKHYDDQVLAHFGYKVPHDPKHEISCFGHDHGLIHIGEVISTADTTGAGLGEIAGKGYGSSQNKPHKFTAPCHGVVMAIFSVVPDIAYGDYYLKANAVTSRFDLFMPEYDNLGMQPLFRYEGDITAAASARNDIMGWQYRYEQYKRRFNRVSRAFQGIGSLDSWMLDFSAPSIANAANTQNSLEYQHRPQELNQIMLVNYVDTVPSSTDPDEIVYDGDPFVVDGYIHCKKNSVMSDYSLPRLDA